MTLKRQRRPGAGVGAEERGHTASGTRGNSTANGPPLHPGVSPAQRLLGRLDGVRSSSLDRWLARCPAHEDKAPSLSIRELPDGTALLRCFAGCSAEAVTEAVGLTMRDLFVRKPQSNRPSQSGAQGNRSVPDALRAATFESLVVLVCAEDMARGKALTDADRERLHTAVVRLHRAAEALRGHH